MTRLFFLIWGLDNNSNYKYLAGKQSRPEINVGKRISSSLFINKRVFVGKGEKEDKNPCPLLNDGRNHFLAIKG